MALRGMLISDLIHCSLETPTTEIAGLMKDEDIGAVVVLNELKPVGIITDRDLALRVIGEARNGESTVAQEIMSRAVVTSSADGTLDDVLAAMEREGVRRVVLTEPDGRAAGLLSLGDLCHFLSGELSALVTPAIPRGLKLTITAPVPLPSSGADAVASTIPGEKEER